MADNVVSQFTRGSCRERAYGRASLESGSLCQSPSTQSNAAVKSLHTTAYDAGEKSWGM